MARAREVGGMLVAVVPRGLTDAHRRHIREYAATVGVRPRVAPYQPTGAERTRLLDEIAARVAREEPPKEVEAVARCWGCGAPCPAPNGTNIGSVGWYSRRVSLRPGTTHVEKETHCPTCFVAGGGWIEPKEAPGAEN